MGELLNLYGSTDNTNTTGTFDLYGDLVYKPSGSTLTYIRIPKGMKAKIWFKSVSGASATISVQYTDDVTASSPTWNTVETINLASSGEIDIDKRKPIILHGITGKEAFQITWSQSTAGYTYVELGVEFSED